MIIIIILFFLGSTFNVHSDNYVAPIFNPATNIVTSPYGTFEITEPLLQQALQTPAIERLKSLCQSGLTKFMLEGDIELTRYGHSVGVMLLIRRFGGEPLEQLAGLFHDASHPGFSHLADLVFKSEAFQDEHHNEILGFLEVDAFLEPFGLVINDINHKSGAFTMLEQDRPDMCADRIEYSLSTSLCLGLITQGECDEITAALSYRKGKWYFTNQEQAKKFAQLPLKFGPRLLSSIPNRLIYHWGAIAIRQAIADGAFTEREYITSTDAFLLEKLNTSENPVVKKCMDCCKSCQKHYKICSPEEATHFIHQKFWGINPLVLTATGLERLTALNEDFCHEYQEAASSCDSGCPVIMSDPSLLGLTKDLN